ncbi:12962_t:CDS:2, partial [Racocetra fulgida]
IKNNPTFFFSKTQKTSPETKSNFLNAVSQIKSTDPVLQNNTNTQDDPDNANTQDDSDNTNIQDDPDNGNKPTIIE